MRRTLLVASALLLVATRAHAEEPLEPLPPPASASASAPAPAAAPAPAPADETQFVTVSVEADKPGVHLEALTVGEGWIHIRGRWRSYLVYGRAPRWQNVCEAPCTIRVPPSLRYRVAGPSVPGSDDFTVGPPGGARQLRVSAGSRSAQFGGGLMVTLGVPAGIVGLVLAADADDKQARTAGYITLGAAALLVAGGATLIALNSTNVYDASGRQVGASGTSGTRKGPRLTPTGLVF